jgi:hypothetical protein
MMDEVQKNSFTQHGYLLCGELISVCTVGGVPLSVPHVLVDCSCYNKDHHTFHLHSTLCDMLWDNCCSMSNMLVFLSGTGLAKAI